MQIPQRKEGDVKVVPSVLKKGKDIEQKLITLKQKMLEQETCMLEGLVPWL